MPDPTTVPLLAVHAGVTLMLAGLVWFVQIVHYPLMRLLDPEELPAYAAEHAHRTGWVVGPLMLAEVASATLIVWLQPAGVPAWSGLLGAALLTLIWLLTGWVQAPLHRVLQIQGDAGRIPELVATNWMRTAAWSARSVLALLMLILAVAA